MMLFNVILFVIVGYIVFLAIQQYRSSTIEQESRYATKEDIELLNQKIAALQQLMAEKSAVEAQNHLST